MNTEYEATFTNVNKDEVRSRLKKAGAKLVKKEFLQKRFDYLTGTVQYIIFKFFAHLRIKGTEN